MTALFESAPKRDWTKPTREMCDMNCLSGVTLTAACRALGLPTSGTKARLADRLLDNGQTAETVQESYGWRARKGSR